MDGVEIHGAHGYLVDQFFWEGSNQRTDEYWRQPGSTARAFAIELIQAVRAAVGAGFPIIFRFSQWKQQDYTARLVQTPEALGEFLKPLSDRWRGYFPLLDAAFLGAGVRRFRAEPGRLDPAS